MSLKTQNEKKMLTDLRLWARWRKSDRHYQLGYPKQSAEQNIPTTGNKALPSWESEMQIDGLVEHEMPKSYRRVVVAAYNIPQREMSRNIETNILQYFELREGVVTWEGVLKKIKKKPHRSGACGLLLSTLLLNFYIKMIARVNFILHFKSYFYVIY